MLNHTDIAKIARKSFDNDGQVNPTFIIEGTKDISVLKLRSVPEEFGQLAAYAFKPLVQPVSMPEIGSLKKEGFRGTRSADEVELLAWLADVLERMVSGQTKADV